MRQLTPGLVVLSLLVAMGFGALHALEPGHGKTLVAAYLVGERGTAWHALLLGLTVTASHTIGVFVLGAVALFASHYIVPEQLYPWLNLVSGLLIAGMGGMLLRQACLRSLGYTPLITIPTILNTHMIITTTIITITAIQHTGINIHSTINTPVPSRVPTAMSRMNPDHVRNYGRYDSMSWGVGSIA